MANPLRSMTLKTRILLLVMGFVFIGIWGLAARAAAVLQADLEKLIAEQLLSQVGFVAAELDGEFQFRIDALTELAASITPEMLADPIRIQRFLEQHQVVGALFPAGILAVNRDGVVIADYPSAPGKRHGVFLGDRDYFRYAMVGNKPAIGAPTRGLFFPQGMAPISVPLHDVYDATAGILVAPVALSSRDLFGKLEEARIGRTGKFLVMSARDKLVLSATDKTRIMKPLPPKGANALLDRRLYEGFEGAGVITNSLGVEVATANRNMKTTGWVVIADITAEEIFAPIRSRRNEIYLTALLMSLLIAAALIIVLKRQMRPLEEAGRAMRRMSEGREPFAPLPVRREDETGELVRNFNQLVSERQRAENEIRDLNQSLEARVIERTQQLLAANQLLKTEIEERKLAQASISSYTDRLHHMTYRMVAVQEEERRRLARELHDQVSSSLAVVCIDIDLIKAQLPEEVVPDAAERLSECAALVRDIVTTVRGISSDLHPAILDYCGLIPALEDFGKKFEKRTGILVRVSNLNGEIRLPADKESALFRIAQEALMNCVKHSGAKTVAIELTDASARVSLSIKDDGQGFDPAELGLHGQTPGLGLLSMQERAQAIGAACRVESAHGRGTQVIVEVGL